MTRNELKKAAKEAEIDQHARLIAADRNMLRALQAVAEIINTARGYFPKSIRNSDTFHLNVVAAEVNSAIHKATS